jgi:hypothetical protein
MLSIISSYVLNICVPLGCDSCRCGMWVKIYATFLEGVESALNGELKLPRELRQELDLNNTELEILKLLCHEYLTD